MITMLFLHKETINLLLISHLRSSVNREEHLGEM